MSEPEARHRLAAILAADAAGYSRVVAEDDRVALAARIIFRKYIEAQGGRVIDTAGDSVLASFETATGAVRAAVAIQRKLSTTAQGQHNAMRLSFRIGVHLGDVLEKADGSVYGDGVNIAARLQALCEPDGVMVSQAVHGAVASRIRGGFAAVLTRKGRHAEARLALAEFFEASRPIGWQRLGNFGNTFVELALQEQRFSAAASLLGYAREAWRRQSTQRRSAELLAELETVLDAETLDRLLARGKALDEEAVYALTLETVACG
jgi:class 3 adenylate cyclase